MVKKRFLLILPIVLGNWMHTTAGSALSQPAVEPVRAWIQGDLKLEWRSDSLQILRVSRDHEIALLSPLPGENLFSVGTGGLSHHEQRGSFRLDFAEAAVCDRMQIASHTIQGETLELRGRFEGPADCRGGFSLQVRPQGQNTLALSLRLDSPRIRSIRLHSRLDKKAWYRGLGAQPSRLDLEGGRFELIAQEGGIGRGAQPLSALVELASPGSAGHAGSSYFPLPMMWSSQNWSLKLLDPEPAIWDFGQEQLTLTQSGSCLNAVINVAESPLELMTAVAGESGRQPVLPDWLHRGAVIGIQGGTQRVRALWERLQAQGTPISALWIQDWVGRRKTAIGSQLWWNWELDQAQYPDWQGLRTALEQSGVRLMGYVNPFLVDVAGRPHRRNLYAEAAVQGFLVRNRQGGVYQVQNTDFAAGMLDLSNDAARAWFIEVLRTQLIEQAGFSGWMADYGEALPLDAGLDAANPLGFHNLYPIYWARLQAMAAGESDRVWFLRSGFAGSQAFAPLFWLGDQSVYWSREDGLASCLTGLLSSGLSGIPVMHCDAGGYTSVAQLGLRRDRELLARWVELSAFTALLRTHEGNQPEANAQVYDQASIAHFARMAKVFAALFPIRKALLVEASQKAWPLVRHPALHYPDDEVAQALSDQFLYGADFMVAPVLEPLSTRRRLYLPAGRWVHLWSGKDYGDAQRGTWVEIDAPLGQPPVFYRSESKTGASLRNELAQQGLL